MNVNENSEGDGNMLYRIACCDDEQQILDRLKECFVRLEVQTDIETQVDYYTDGRNLIQAYQADHSKYDIILLDMEMPLISGMQVAEQMRRINREVIIIFLTSYPEYMQQSFRVQPFQYLMKPLETDSFIKEIQNAMNYLRTDHHKILLHTEQGELLQSIHVWRQQHPDGRKADCHRDTGLDPKTIRKWWDSEPSAVWQEDGHMVARVRPSQALSDLLVDALKKSED